MKTGSSIKSQKHQVSTKSSGTNTNSYYNNYNLNCYKEKSKNGIEKNNKLEIQGINEYSIINDLNLLDNEFLNLQTTLQTLTDSKILDLANNYISEDDSLERYKRYNNIYNIEYIFINLLFFFEFFFLNVVLGSVFGSWGLVMGDWGL